MAKLYELTNDINAVTALYEMVDESRLAIIDMETGEYTDQEKADAIAREEELIKEFEREIIDQIQNKTDNVAKFIVNEEADILALKNEEKRLSEKRKKAEKKVESIKEYVKFCMTGMNVKEIKTTLGSFKLSKSKAVEITNEEILPPEVFIEKKEASKTLIKEYLKTHNDIQGAGIVEREKVNFK